MQLNQFKPAECRQVFEQELDRTAGAGTILQDFGMLLAAIGPGGLPVSGQFNRPALKVLPELNARLTHPLQLDLKRPQLKSYPHLGGLYLLARATGLTYVGHLNDKARLFVDPPALAAWAALNPVEQYFTLLESWLLRGNLAILGERDTLNWLGERIQSWAYFFESIPDAGRPIAGDQDAEQRLRYTPGLYNLALMELFGLVTIDHLPPEPGGGWRIGRIHRTRLGEVILYSLHEHFARNFETMLDYADRDPEEVPLGELQPVFQPYAPEWRQNLVLPERVFQDGRYVFKVSLGRVWRRIAIPGRLTLDALSSAILNAYEFDHDHLDRFTYLNRFGAPAHVNHPFLEEGPSTSEVRVGDLPLRPGAHMIYLFDFGDQWEFEVQLEWIDPMEPWLEEPVLLESQGQAPEQYPSWDADEFDDTDELF